MRIIAGLVLHKGEFAGDAGGSSAEGRGDRFYLLRGRERRPLSPPRWNRREPLRGSHPLAATGRHNAKAAEAALAAPR